MRLIALAAATAAVLVLALPVEASAPPVGKLPKGPVTTVRTPKGTFVSIALPHLKGLSWRVARQFDPRVVAETGEADVGTTVVIVYRAKMWSLRRRYEPAGETPGSPGRGRSSEPWITSSRRPRSGSTESWSGIHGARPSTP